MSETIVVEEPSEEKKSEMKQALLRMRRTKVTFPSKKGKEEEVEQEETFPERPNETLQRLNMIAQRKMHQKKEEEVEEEKKKPCGGSCNQGAMLITVLAAASAVVLGIKLYRWMYPSISNESQLD